MASTTPAPNPAEVTITIAGQQYPVKFNTNVMRDWSKLTKRPSSEFGLAIFEDHIEAFSGIIACAVRRFVPTQADFTQDQAADLLGEMSQPEADAIAKVLFEVTTTPSPLLTALNKHADAKRQAFEPVTTESAEGAASAQAS
jgi:hypothetical protein